ncbi:acyl-CoA synthetase (AMP-forming)/AMP-acid ligase II [Crossiella equi]|uniref:Acyl-CoA synthetase (AMP-forming)/AMP-acid ligase II n=2 Tax=Crossiella equi TaxID=130796 RepID=A0ABS5A9V4_9PSEU|nr:acyl-CoA synthetase (AMP-forming)/AMP-acid ligase II [Crossiella equi]
MIAAYKLRAVAINVNYRYLKNELQYLFDNADLVALVHERRHGELVDQVRPHVPKLAHTVVIPDESEVDSDGTPYEDALADGEPERDFPARSADDRYILYTGGTTGNPKGVVWRHEDIWRVLGGGIDFFSGDKIPDEWHQSRAGKDFNLVRLPVAPLIHGAAQWATFQNLFGCGTVVLTPHFDADEVWRAVQEHRVNVLLIVGDAMARPLIEAYHRGGYDASSLYAVSSSAALFSPSVKQQFLDAFPNLVLTDSIGSSETGFNGIGVVDRGGTQRGGPRVKVDPDTAVIDEHGKPVPPGCVGRLARTGHLPLGYYKDPAKTATMLTEIDGRRYAVPGDYARVEEDGTVTLLGRGNTSINTGGEKVYPEEVEGALKSHPDVFDALVVGIPDERLGQRVAALVQPRPDTAPDFADLDAHVRGLLAGYKVPRGLWLVDHIGRSPSGKPDYRWATRYVEEHPDENVAV